MHYNIREIPEAEFNRMRYFVERAYQRVNRRGPVGPVDINVATTDAHDLTISPKRKKRVLNDRYAGFAFQPENDIWLKGGRSAFDMRRTAIHEIAHLRSEGDTHGPKWRKTFGIAWAMWMREHGHSWAEVRKEIADNTYRYRKYRAWTPKGEYNIYSEFTAKVQKEIDDVFRAAQAICN